jgi:CDP-diacylglycerol--glycerol-3-phosphate 3-phosphatidyltransferase
MEGSNVTRPLPARIRLGLPLLGAVALALLLYVALPATDLDYVIVHPAILAGLSWGALLFYVANAVETAGRPAGLANLVTMLRGALYAVVSGFVVVSPTSVLAWIPAVAYGTGATLDKLDGTLARTVGRETAVGERLDMAFDTFGFVAAPLLAVVWGQLPVWYLSLSATRYVYRAGTGYRRRQGRPVYDLPDDDLSKYLAGVQMAFLTAALAPFAPTGIVFAVAPLVLAPSLAVFARDFLVVTGRLGRSR